MGTEDTATLKSDYSVTSDVNTGIYEGDERLTFGKKRAKMKKRMMREAIMPVLIPAE